MRQTVAIMVTKRKIADVVESVDENGADKVADGSAIADGNIHDFSDVVVSPDSSSLVDSTKPDGSAEIVPENTNDLPADEEDAAAGETAK